MHTVMVFFPKIRGFFFDFLKRVGETTPLLPFLRSWDNEKYSCNTWKERYLHICTYGIYQNVENINFFL